MQSFTITEAQVASLAAALTGDELSRNFGKYTDFLTQAEWSSETVLGAGGLNDTALGLSEAETAACAQRLLCAVPVQQ